MQRLRVYLSSALTDVPDNERANFFAFQDRVERYVKEAGLDIYVPRHNTDPKKHANIDSFTIYQQDRRELTNSDVVLALAHYTSFGEGQELEMAKNGLIPIILVKPDTRGVSRMVRGIPTLVREISFNNEEDLRVKLQLSLQDLAAVTSDRQWLRDAIIPTELGRRVRDRREALGIDASDFAALVGIRPEELSAIETEPEWVTNPSLHLLRALALGLRTTVAELLSEQNSPTSTSFGAEIAPTKMGLVAARAAPHVPPGDALIIRIRRMRYELNKRVME